MKRRSENNHESSDFEGAPGFPLNEREWCKQIYILSASDRRWFHNTAGGGKPISRGKSQGRLSN